MPAVLRKPGIIKCASDTTRRRTFPASFINNSCYYLKEAYCLFKTAYVTLKLLRIIIFKAYIGFSKQVDESQCTVVSVNVNVPRVLPIGI